MLKKIFGIVLMSIALLLTLGAIGLLANIVKAFVGVYFIFSGNLDSYAQGEAIGRLLYWIAHIAITYVFWTNGLRLWNSKKRYSYHYNL